MLYLWSISCSEKLINIFTLFRKLWLGRFSSMKIGIYCNCTEFVEMYDPQILLLNFLLTKAFVCEFQFPISFAIHFVMPKDKVLNKLEVECAKHPSTQKDPKKPDAPKQTDEADSSRTQVSCINP